MQQTIGHTTIYQGLNLNCHKTKLHYENLKLTIYDDLTLLHLTSDLGTSSRGEWERILSASLVNNT